MSAGLPPWELDAAALDRLTALLRDPAPTIDAAALREVIATTGRDASPQLSLFGGL